MKKQVETKSRVILALLILLLVLGTYVRNITRQQEANRPRSAVEIAFADRLSNIQVEGYGMVTGLLPDDLEGDRHQKFILQITPEQSVVIAHNVELAPRINTLSRGDRVDFFGHYRWNSRGGIIHRTHHDPQKQLPDGWLRHQGKLYQAHFPP
jgi:hypothetical protein